VGAKILLYFEYPKFLPKKIHRNASPEHYFTSYQAQKKGKRGGAK
jgi:hypothetical protein